MSGWDPSRKRGVRQADEERAAQRERLALAEARERRDPLRRTIRPGAAAAAAADDDRDHPLRRPIGVGEAVARRREEEARLARALEDERHDWGRQPIRHGAAAAATDADRDHPLRRPIGVGEADAKTREEHEAWKAYLSFREDEEEFGRTTRRHRDLKGGCRMISHRR